MHVAIIGGTTVDLIFPRVASLPVWPGHTEFTRSNLTLLKEPPLVSLGGNGANAAYVAVRRGATVTLHTQLAPDPLGQLALGWLRSAGCTVRLPGRATASAVNVTAANARHQRATFFYPGTAPVLPDPAGLRRGTGFVLVCGWPHPPLSDIGRLFAALSQRRILTLLDTGPILDRPWSLAGLAPVFRSLGLLLTNEHELITITGAPSLPHAIVRLRRCFAGDVAIKRGARGAWWLPAGAAEVEEVPAPRVKVVNTVGAGDSFNGALLAALARGVLPRHAIVEAVKTASAVVASGRGVLGAPAFAVRKTRSR